MTSIGGGSHGKSRNGEAVARQLGVTPRIRGLGGRLEYWPQTPADACRRDPDPKGDASAGATVKPGHAAGAAHPRARLEGEAGLWAPRGDTKARGDSATARPSLTDRT